MRRFFSVLFLAVSVGFAAWVFLLNPTKTDGYALNLASHRAMYDVSLSNLNAAGNLVGLKGLMVYEWRKSCNAYVTTTRSTLTYSYADGQSKTVNADMVSEEAIDGSRLRFTTRRESGGVLEQEVAGTADKTGVHYLKPERTDLALTPGTLFPMQHTRKAYEHAKNKELQFEARLFDGAEPSEGAILVNTFIGKIETPEMPNADLHIDKKLLQPTVQNYIFSFFKDTTDDATPDYEMRVKAQDNGIVRDLTIAYDDFGIRQSLKALQKLDDLPCTPKQ